MRLFACTCVVMSLHVNVLVQLWVLASDVLWMTTHSCVRRELSRLLWQSPDWCSEEDDRQVATCPQLGSTNCLEHALVWPGTRSFPAGSAALAGCCWPGSVQSLRTGVQMSAQDGSWISVCLLPARLRRLWPSAPAVGWPWSSRFPTCGTCFVRRTFICMRRPFELELTSCLPWRQLEADRKRNFYFRPKKKKYRKSTVFFRPKNNKKIKRPSLFVRKRKTKNKRNISHWTEVQNRHNTSLQM